MNEQLEPLLNVRSPATLRWRAVRLAFVVVALGVLLSASTLLVGGGWVDAPTRGVAAGEQQNNRPTPDAEATAKVERASLLYLNAALQPSPTPTQAPPTPTSTPEPPPAQPAQAQGSPPPAQSQPQPAPQVAAPPPAAAPGCPTQGMSGFALDLFNAINSARSQNGMGTLAANGCVTYVAQIRSNDMASRGYFAHVSPDGSSAFTLLDAYAIPSGWAGENLARNNYPASETVAVAIRDLMASPPHRQNILGANYTSMGVAVTLDATGIYYYTMIFVGPA